MNCLCAAFRTCLVYSKSYVGFSYHHHHCSSHSSGQESFSGRGPMVLGSGHFPKVYPACVFLFWSLPPFDLSCPHPRITDRKTGGADTHSYPLFSLATGLMKKLGLRRLGHQTILAPAQELPHCWNNRMWLPHLRVTSLEQVTELFLMIELCILTGK
jgi:hypothetical protein